MDELCLLPEGGAYEDTEKELDLAMSIARWALGMLMHFDLVQRF